MTPIPDKPSIDCPDCGAQMPLQSNPWRRGGDAWIYLCERRIEGCKGKVGAHPNGEPVGTPAPYEVRQARIHVHKVLDALWRDAHLQYGKKGKKKNGGPPPSKLRQIARRRAYDWLSAHLGVEEFHVSHCTDLETLREAYRLCRSATPEKIRAWAKERGAA